MKLLKFILPITALLMIFSVVESTAQICVYDETHEYKLEDAIKYKGNEFEFIKFCCEELGSCAPGYAAYGHYYLTHVAAMYKRDAVLRYLVDVKGLPEDEYPAFVKPGDKVEYRTQVMMSAVRGDYSSTKFLVDRGARVSRKDPTGKDALDYAKESGNKQVIEYVRKAWNKEKGFSEMLIEKEKAKLRNLLKPEAIQKHFAQNTAANSVVQTTKPFIQSAAQAQDFKQI